MASNLTIIENTDKAREEYGTLWGINYINISEEDIKALYEGKCLAYDDGEYSTFITLDKEDDENESV